MNVLKIKKMITSVITYILDRTLINLKSYLFDDGQGCRVRLYCTLDDLVDQATLASD